MFPILYKISSQVSRDTLH